MPATAPTVLPLAAVPASTTALRLSENSHHGVTPLKTTSPQAWSVAKSLNASGMAACLYDSGRRTRSTGKERDAETRLDWFASRYFSAAQGRFTSPDSLMGKPEWLVDPQRWNRYAYVRNNPLKYIDPKGEDLTVYWSLGNDLSPEDLEWFKKNKQAVLDAIRAKYEKAGVKNVNIRELSTLSKEQIAELDKKSPFGVDRLLVAGRQYPGIKPEAPLGTLGYTHPDSKNISAIFLDAFPRNPSPGCDAVCIAGNVGAHEIGHALGMDHGTTWEIMKEFLRVQVGGGSPDLMMGTKAFRLDRSISIRRETKRREPLSN
jgi:RHS repeat-associated protein